MAKVSVPTRVPADSELEAWEPLGYIATQPAVGGPEFEWHGASRTAIGLSLLASAPADVISFVEFPMLRYGPFLLEAVDWVVDEAGTRWLICERRK